MAKFCSKCGAQMDDNLMFCGNCGAKADAPAAQAAPQNYAPAARPASNIDFVGIITGKTDAKTNWIAAIVMQVLSAILFFLPMVRWGKGDNKETYGLFKQLFNGEENCMKVWILVMMIAVFVSIVYMMVPLFRNTRLVPAAALLTAVTQFMFFFSTFLCVLKLVGDADDAGAKVGTTFGFWAFVIVSALSLFATIRIVVANKKEFI